MVISEYFKYDLHIHSNASNITKDNDYNGEFSVSKLIKKISKEKVDVFSLTDHNIFNIEAYEELATIDGINYFIGIEFDILKGEYLLDYKYQDKNVQYNYVQYLNKVLFYSLGITSNCNYTKMI